MKIFISGNQLFPGVPLALGSAALFGATPAFSKLLLDTVSPLMLAGIFYLGAGIGLSIYMLLRSSAARESEARLKRSDLPFLALAIVAGGIVGPVLLMLGVERSAASTSSLLLNLEGLATMAIAWIAYRENVDRRLLAGALAILAGAVVISWNGNAVAPSPGAMLVAGACLAWGLDNNFTRKISAADPVAIAAIKGLVAGTVNIALAFASGANWPPAGYALAGAAVGFFGIGVSLVMFILALRHLGTARTGAYYSLAPFIGAILAIAGLGETPTLRLAFAGALMAFGLWLHLSERHDHEHQHEVTEHDHSHLHDEHHDHSHNGEIPGSHSHWHRHEPLGHKHQHYPDLHHRHGHS